VLLLVDVLGGCELRATSLPARSHPNETNPRVWHCVWHRSAGLHWVWYCGPLDF